MQPNVQLMLNKISHLDPVLSQKNPVHGPTLKICFKTRLITSVLRIFELEHFKTHFRYAYKEQTPNKSVRSAFVPRLMKRTLSCSVPSQFLFVVINNYIKTCLTDLIWFTTIHVVLRLTSENRRFNYNDHINFLLLSYNFRRVVTGE